MKQKYFQYFVEVTKLTSKLSTCISKQVGCILIKDNRIIASSYNGVPSGVKHCNEIFDKSVLTSKIKRDKHHEWSNNNELHGEANLLSYCGKMGIKTDNGILFTSLSPCITCAKMIFASGIKEIFYLEEYDKDNKGIDFLKQNMIKIELI